MPVIQVGGNRVYLGDDEAASRYHELEARERDGRLKEFLDIEEHRALGAWYESVNLLRSRAQIPGATERVNNGRAGYGSQPQGGWEPPPKERGGWISVDGGDPNAAQHRTAAMKTVEHYNRSGVLSATAADVVDGVLRRGDPRGETARYITAVGDPHYASAFGKMIMDPQMGHLRFGPKEVEAVREAGFAEASSRAFLTTGTSGFPLPLTIDPTNTRELGTETRRSVAVAVRAVYLRVAVPADRRALPGAEQRQVHRTVEAVRVEDHETRVGEQPVTQPAQVP